jgi:predicted exporter
MLIRPESGAGLFVGLISIAGLVALVLLRWPGPGWLAADFQALLPDDDSSRWVSIAHRQLAETYEGQLIWLVEGEEAEEVNRYAHSLRQQLERAGYADPNFETRQIKRWQELTATLLEHHRGLLTPEDYQLLQRDPGAYFEQSRRLLYSPLGGPALNLLERDPSGLFANFLARISPAQPTHSLHDTGLHWELLIVSMPAEKRGLRKLPDLYNLYQSLQQQAKNHHLALYATGAPLYTAYGVQSAQKEVSTIGLASLVLLMTLLLFSLRSVAAVVLTFACIFSGVTAGLLVTVAVLQQIHVLTLVFGASLIGIAADYALHYLAHSRAADWTPALGLGKVYRALRLSMLSSVVAFGALMLLPFPGVRQIGLFMASGLFCSFLTVCLVFPALYRGTNNKVPLSHYWSRSQWQWRHAGVCLAALILAALGGISQLPGKDDVREFYASPPALAAAQNRITSVLSALPDSRFLLLEASDQTALLRLEERLANALHTLQARQALASFAGIGSLIPALETQQKSAELLASAEFGALLEEHMSLLGMSEELQVRMLASLQQPFEPLGIETLGGALLPPGVGGFLGCDDDGCASRIDLAGVNAVADLEAITRQYQGVQLIDQIATINRVMGQYRRAIAALLAVSAVLMATLIAFQYGWRLTAAILVGPSATCLFSLLLVGSWQEGISLINLMALLLLVGVSLDYSIFRVFSAARDQATTALAISLSAATSILAFGLLGFSETPVISSFGQTIAVGLVFAWLFSWMRLTNWEPS